MIVTTEDLVGRFASKGDFQNFVDGLVRSAGRVVGIGSESIHSDYRINVGDRGIDIRVEKSHANSSESFIPQSKSIWSIKSGKVAFSPSSFHAEVLKEGHENVVEYLSRGYRFVWCSIAASRPEDQRKPVEDSVPALISKLANLGVVVDASQFAFRWNDCVAVEARKHPALLIEHFPELAARFRAVNTIQEWREQDPNSTEWVNFGERDQVRDEILRHLSVSSRHIFLILAWNKRCADKPLQRVDRANSLVQLGILHPRF